MISENRTSSEHVADNFHTMERNLDSHNYDEN
jgi:hypothetical protein